MRFSRSLLLSQAYRPFFPLAALATSVSVFIWLCGLSGLVTLPPQPTLWHAHEMLFGFAAAVILGFVLTAVQNWTGLAAISARSLGLLVGLWVLARILAFWPERLGQTLSAAADVFVLPLGTVLIARVLITTRNWRNAVFIPLLSALALLNIGFHWAMQREAASLARELVVITVWCVAFLMIFMGGRVIPFFSGRRLAYAPVQLQWLNWVSTLGAAATIAGVALGSGSLVTITAAITATATALRWVLWQPWRAAGEPMLWILQLGYGWLILGYALLALDSAQTFDIPASMPLHVVMAGGLGCLGIGMMTRVALGHSQRPIQADAVVALAFSLAAIAGLLRVASYVDGPFAGLRGLTLSALCWVGAFSIYAMRFAAALWFERTDAD